MMLQVRIFSIKFVFMGALTLNINNLHSSLGAQNIIEIDETKFSLIIYDRTFKNKGSRILQLIIGWRIKNVF